MRRFSLGPTANCPDTATHNFETDAISDAVDEGGLKIVFDTFDRSILAVVVDGTVFRSVTRAIEFARSSLEPGMVSKEKS